MTDTLFESFGKIPRWNRDIIITEKIDGTNAQIFVSEQGNITLKSGREVPFLVGSRNRWIFPESDNHGFAKWAYGNEKDVLSLGPGRHFGEWFGQGIQRGYGLKEKKLIMFNVSRWNKDNLPQSIGVVPVLYQGPMFYYTENAGGNRLSQFDDSQNEDGPIQHWATAESLYMLKTCGSFAVPGYMKPEGIVIFHSASHHMYKITLENDSLPKGAL
jgi:hypothetical protein